MSAAAPAHTLPEKVAHLIGYSNAALEKADAALAAHEASLAKVAELIPTAVKALVDNERIQPGEEKLAAELLKDPVKVMQLLTKVAAHRNAGEHTLGQPVDAAGQAKQAGHTPASSLTNAHVGARTSELRESDVRLFTKLGLAPPTR